jgi:predicted enzyme related to lactoylglutathione lyase
MSERNQYRVGEFCWVELVVTDPDAATSFYGELMGWEREHYESDPEAYWYFKYRGKRVAGLEGVLTGQAPAWLGYVRVDDLEELAAKVKDAGGAVLEGPLSVPGGAGDLAICKDTEGAVFALWRPGDSKGAELVNEAGAWTWNNLMSRDLDKAKDFYGEVFGWEAAQNPEIPEGILNWQVEGQRWPEGLGGLLAMGEEMPAEVPPHWQVYFLVEDLDGAIETTKGAGGQLLFGPQEIPVGRFAVLIDPQGANLALMEPDYPEPR